MLELPIAIPKDLLPPVAEDKTSSQQKFVLDTRSADYYKQGISKSRIRLIEQRDFHPNELQAITCLLCSSIFIDPVSCKNCYRNFCQGCIIQHLENSPEKLCPCGSKFELHTPNKGILKSLARLTVSCRFAASGCTQRPYYENLFEHEDICEFRRVMCLFLSCPEILKIKDVQAHELKCVHQSVKCMYCQSTFRKDELKKHESKCPSRQRHCPGCKKSIPNPNFEDHLASCTYRMETCQRCGDRMPQSEIDNHTQVDCLRVYFERLQRSHQAQVVTMKETILELQRKLDARDPHMINYRCRGCLRFGTESVMTECSLCQDGWFCLDCEKVNVKKCLKCSVLFCSVCQKFSNLDKFCITCDKQQKEVTVQPKPATGKKWRAARSSLANNEGFLKAS